jgi:hypothetical protein
MKPPCSKYIKENEYLNPWRFHVTIVIKLYTHEIIP